MSPPKPSRILVVDDDIAIRETLSDALSDEGYEVAAAADGVEALDVLAAGDRPQLILLDWMMPRCDGCSFAARMKALPDFGDVPVVLLTADGRSEEKARQVGAVDHVRKPVSLDELLELVRRHTGDGAS